jgi:hypothetical protein
MMRQWHHRVEGLPVLVWCEHIIFDGWKGVPGWILAAILSIQDVTVSMQLASRFDKSSSISLLNIFCYPSKQLWIYALIYHVACILFYATLNGQIAFKSNSLT